MLPSKKHSDAAISIKINDTIFSDLEQITHAFNEFFVSVESDSAQNTSSNYSRAHFLRNRVSSSMVLFSPSPQEVASTLKRLKTNKSSGDDQIPLSFITIAADVISPYLSFLIDFMFSNGLFPSILKIAKVIPIFKSEEKQTVYNYRPISLLSPFSKVIEKIIKVRLLSFIATNDILFQQQSGFRKKFTTMFPIIDSVSDCFDNINDKKYSCAIALDIRKAFDSVNHAILLNKLEHYGIRGVCHKLFSSYLENRKQYVCVNNVKSSLQRIKSGVPQGSVLGPILFLLYINDLPNTLSSPPRLFADDTFLYSSNDIHQLKSLCNGELRQIKQWINANKLEI